MLDNHRPGRTGANRHGENGRNEAQVPPAPDPIGAAIASAQQVQMVQFQMPLPTSGRLCVIVAPADLSEREALGMHSLVNSVYDQLYAKRHPESQIVVPGPGVVLPRPG